MTEQDEEAATPAEAAAGGTPAKRKTEVADFGVSDSGNLIDTTSSVISRILAGSSVEDFLASCATYAPASRSLCCAWR